MKQLEETMKNLDDNSENIEVKNKIFSELQLAYSEESSQLKQKARLKWETDGDTNSRLFHRMVLLRRSQNQINRIVWKNQVLTSPEEIKESFFQYFRGFFQCIQGTTSFNLQSLDCYCLNEIEVARLERPFSIEEIEFALKESDSNKAPGPDGFNVGWLRFMWESSSKKIIDFFFQIFHKKATIPQW